MVLTRKRKRLILSGAAVLAALAVAIPFLPRLETVAAPYRGVARVALPNFTRVEMPGSEGTEPTAGEGATQPLLADETVAVALEEAPPQPEVAPGTRPSPSARSAPGNIIPVKFDIETPGLGDEVVGGDEIIVRKKIRLGSREIGSLPIHVDARSRLLVRPSDLRSVLEKAGQGERVRDAASSNELRTFAELRRDGLDLRYDPNSDSVVVTIG